MESGQDLCFSNFSAVLYSILAPRTGPVIEYGIKTSCSICSISCCILQHCVSPHRSSNIIWDQGKLCGSFILMCFVAFWSGLRYWNHWLDFNFVLYFSIFLLPRGVQQWIMKSKQCIWIMSSWLHLINLAPQRGLAVKYWVRASYRNNCITKNGPPAACWIRSGNRISVFPGGREWHIC